MKVYRIILTIVLVAVVAFGVWYCLSAYNEQSSGERGLLVRAEYQQGQEMGECRLQYI